MACIIDSCVPTASMTECAPRPMVRSLSFATPPSPRSVMTSVAPKSLASFWRSSWRLKMTMGSAPACFAPGTQLLACEHAEQADGAIADDGDGLARSCFGGDGGEPAGAEHVGGGE